MHLMISLDILYILRHTFKIFFFHVLLFDGVHFQYFQELLSFFFSERSDFFLIW